MELDFGSTFTRRLPVYFLIGTGDTMIGKPIQAVKEGLLALHKELLSQPQAVEQVWLSIITFASSASQVAPLTTILQFSLPSLIAGGDYHLGQGINALVKSLQREITPTSAGQKRDYRPLVFLIFDNEPTDRWERELTELEKARTEKSLGSLIAIGLGERVNLAVLRQLTNSVLWMPELKLEALHSFFHWTSASVDTVSRSVALFPVDDMVQLPKPPDGVKVIM